MYSFKVHNYCKRDLHRGNLITPVIIAIAHQRFTTCSVLVGRAQTIVAALAAT